jgi:hypothetical protein
MLRAFKVTHILNVRTKTATIMVSIPGDTTTFSHLDYKAPGICAPPSSESKLYVHNMGLVWDNRIVVGKHL